MFRAVTTPWRPSRSSAEAHQPGMEVQCVSGSNTLLWALSHTLYDIPKRFNVLHKEQLPWLDDFFNTSDFSLPHSASDVLERLNLNLPYYAANYVIALFPLVATMLLWCGTLFFLAVAFSFIVVSVAHRIATRCRDPMIYLFLVPIVAPLLYWNLTTLVTFFATSVVLIITHAVCRRPTYFDDEELEKLRPKSVQYLLMGCLMFLCLLEGGDKGVVEKESPEKVE
uniref:PRA1 family protein n=1 Tax=Trypanosoma vivax (strain Y486) TaxID=1055687 RepID=G0U3Y3_TRYVY|nr:putative RAB-interacting protein [Trypanosoma vivax Y486]